MSDNSELPFSDVNKALTEAYDTLNTVAVLMEQHRARGAEQLPWIRDEMKRIDLKVRLAREEVSFARGPASSLMKGFVHHARRDGGEVATVDAAVEENVAVAIPAVAQSNALESALSEYRAMDKEVESLRDELDTLRKIQIDCDAKWGCAERDKQSARSLYKEIFRRFMDGNSSRLELLSAAKRAMKANEASEMWRSKSLNNRERIGNVEGRLSSAAYHSEMFDKIAELASAEFDAAVQKEQSSR